jgi:hypothetical protein
VISGYSKHVGGPNPKADPFAILNALRLPGRINAEQTAVLLGFAAWDIPLLVKAKLLEPLGNGDAKNCVKYFAAVIVAENASDPKWLDKATKAISRREPSNRSGKLSGKVETASDSEPHRHS